MSDPVRGMVVYHRKDFRRGIVMAANTRTHEIAVQWDSGAKEIILVWELMSEQRYKTVKEEERATNMAIKADQCVIGATVYQAGHAAPLAQGKIAGPLSGSIVIVEWSDGTLRKMNIRDLLSEVDGAVENKRLQDEQERLEQEFAQVEVTVKEKLAEAAKLINEAAALASDGGADIQEMYEATRPLERAMENAGWRTSSWHC